MSNIDLLVIECGDGGELVKENNDLATTQGLQNFIYLAMFGGNVEGSTKEVKPTEERVYWWGNDAFFSEFEEQQVNSETEGLLRKIVMNTQGRLQLIQAVKQDLEFLKAFGETVINVIFESIDRVRIDITLTRLGNENDERFTFVWDATQQELASKNYYKNI